MRAPSSVRLSGQAWAWAKNGTPTPWGVLTGSGRRGRRLGLERGDPGGRSLGARPVTLGVAGWEGARRCMHTRLEASADRASSARPTST
eukprot:scaffold4202_cov370-Prasinococcus_capsulatus_cf.AAC.3